MGGDSPRGDSTVLVPATNEERLGPYFISLRFHPFPLVLWAVPYNMSGIPKIVDAMRRNPRSVRYADLFKVCEHYFGRARNRGSSHAVFKTPWAGDPRVNIQNDHGMAKEYQVRQVMAAIRKLEESNGNEA